MRIAPLVLWVLASLCWLPWALLLVRLGADLAQGVPAASSGAYEPVLVPIAPSFGWSGWHIVSAYPIAALVSFGLSALGWRLSWIIRDGILRRNGFQIGLSILVPPIALFFAWLDARAEHQQCNALLRAGAEEAAQRLSAGKQ